MTTKTLLEAAFPYVEVSKLIAADRRSIDPIYGLHRWWARRPPSLMRAMLIAARMSVSEPDTFWDLYGNDHLHLVGLRVLDPFVGGGSTLIEAARMGADVCGGDVDPLAVRIVKRELTPADPESVRDAGGSLLAFLRTKYAELYPAVDATPLHYFRVAEVTCPSCSHSGLLYRNLIVARDVGKPGAVVRGRTMSVFCPDCCRLHNLATSDRKRLTCCGRHHDIASGTFHGQRYHCPACGSTSTHRQLRTGLAPRVLVAVEEAGDLGHRSMRRPSYIDDSATRRAGRMMVDTPPSIAPVGAVPRGRKDGRPASYGITRFAELFEDRQLLVLGAALEWLASQELDEPVRDSLELAVSNALTTNNRLCGYATDYGRLSGLFSVRGYSLPALAVELNPLHPSAGRGTIASCINRVARAASQKVRRHTWDRERERPVPRLYTHGQRGGDVDLRVASAEKAAQQDGDVDLCLFDPPYFDYISYDELSEFHRAWMPPDGLGGDPLLPSGAEPTNTFGVRLGSCFAAILRRLRSDTPIAFTYHSTNPDAWEAVGIALDEAKLAVTALWPVRSDGHMGHHSHAGNCEWDLVVVTRPITATTRRQPPFTVDEWTQRVAPLRVSSADVTNMKLAISMAASRFAERGESR